MVTVEERFWKHVDKNSTNGCWIWLDGKSSNGYGQFYCYGSRIRAHRFSYILRFGQIPPGLVVCHKCDNPSCVNPDHLFLGTNHDNRIDASKKGRLFRKDNKCRRGHLMTPENTKIDPNGYTRCRTCKHDYEIQYRQKNGTRLYKDRVIRKLKIKGI